MLSYCHTNSMKNGYSPVKRQAKLSSQVAEQVQHLILSRDLKPGDRLPTEREMGETFGVSRTVIREAISTLEALGLVTSLAGSGTYVRMMEGKDASSSLNMFIKSRQKPFSLDELMEVRCVLEIEMVKLAAERATKEEIHLLEECLQNMLATTNLPDEFAKWDLEFHLIQAEACRNPPFGIILEPLKESLLDLIYTTTTTPGAIEKACEYHREVLDCIKKKDAQRAVKVIKKHLEQTHRASVQAIKKREGHLQE